MPTDLHIHLGAHRTATTHLQDTLALHQAELAARGVAAPTRAWLRERNLGGKTLPSGLKRLLPDLVGRLRLSRLLERISGESRRTLISEEKLLGFVRDLLAERIYPELEDRVGLLHRALGDREAVLHLSVRDPGSLLPSAYVHCMRMGNLGLPGFEKIQRRVLAKPFSWLDVLRRLKAAAPGRPIRVWTFESYVANPDAVLSLLTGLEDVRWSPLSAPQSTRGISVETLAKIRDLPSDLGRKAHREECLRLGREDKVGTKFSPFTPDQRLTISQAYREDLARIGDEYPGIFLTAPS
jgi:hypothetical protein